MIYLPSGFAPSSLLYTQDCPDFICHLLEKTEQQRESGDLGRARQYAEDARRYSLEENAHPERALALIELCDIHRESGRLGAALAQSRHQLEGRWGLETLEVPQSRICQSEPFCWFVAHLLARLPRLWEIVPDAFNISREGKNYFPADFEGIGVTAEHTFRNDLYGKVTWYTGERINAFFDDRPGLLKFNFRYPFEKNASLGLDIISAGEFNNLEDAITLVRGEFLLHF